MLKNELYEQLLQPGKYLMLRRRPSGKDAYCLYDGKMKPLRVYHTRSVKPIKNLLKEADGKLTLNLNLVRQLHGNNRYKKQYKKTKSKNHGTRCKAPEKGIQIQKGRDLSYAPGS